MRFVDLSVMVEPTASEPVPVEIEFVSHAEGADILGRAGGIGREEFPDRLGISLEHVKLTSHSGTHVDAPAHYGPFSEGKRARTIDELPLEWFYGPGVLLHCDTGAKEPVSAQEVETELKRIGHTLAPGDIVLINTGADRLWGSAEYFTDFRGVTREATAYLVEHGVKVMGVDSFGFDAPFSRMLAAYQASGDQAELWPAHVYGREREYCHIERLSNLTAISRPTGFTVACFPIKLKDAGAGWSRVVAMVEE
ncbi:cyclase family protein [Streptomyces flavofungini]|uniref:Cyclase family protein n=1 Tax=Streptomyces flavofungini TaxID=68200 RepID=A0ABS0XGL7_9ACTN|nr:cyclase family protein [Streptomyces flavofungini]MBJ3812381.1 cyclase family protein [Streptomyces flavofungini]GHC88085.1 cyclase [Streptomyces flavofungini]